ncbi:RNA-binding protein [Asticcacaulis sp. AND118]|uniref:RNA-binding protein n=1 Tax=Asticcacaulis sp. AND118 TaxID=2840468 RepID=UPI001CFFE747|nr:RNA-binding protein [Asticcacaulis sp. AND118]UDF03562.1 RNA-binding protein [Asticcacaulis sp. AND118]
MTPTPTNETLIDLNDETTEAGEAPSQTVSVRYGNRRDVASHSSVSRDGLIRFVVGPDGYVVPDLKETLPGRGLWLKADAESLALAIKKNLFSRAAKKAVKTPEGLDALVPALIRKRLLDQLGLARREGNLVTGFEKVATALKLGKTVPHAAGRAAWLIEASDGAEDGRGKLLNLSYGQTPAVGLCGLFSNDELSLALGLENVIHATLIEGRRAGAFSREAARLGGFEALFPAKWRERPFNSN